MPEGFGVPGPVTAIEFSEFDVAARGKAEAANVQAEAIRIGARDVKRLDSANTAEQVTRRIGFETVFPELFLASYQLEPAGGNNQVLESAHPANGTIADLRFAAALDLCFELHGATVTTAGHHYSVSHSPLFVSVSNAGGSRAKLSPGP